MRVLFIAPLPPPVTGHSLASKVFLDELSKSHQVKVVNLSKDSFKQGATSFKRIIQVAVILKEVWCGRKNADCIYLTISESFAGNIKDLFIYLICLNSLSKMYIHLHGGSIKKLLFDRHRTLSNINKIFIKKLGGIIVSGGSHVEIFEDMIPRNKIHVVPNFAQDYLFATEKEIADKFSNTPPLRVLFIGGFMKEKGFDELADAYLGLDNNLKKMVRIGFAGKFESESEKTGFLGKIAGVGQICYHGIVDDAEKKSLFLQAHILCLPTSFFEGQPLSILEAYAAGCVVLTTGQSGIRDVFSDGLNGFEIKERSADAIKKVLEKVIKSPGNLLKIAVSNRKTAGEKYRTAIYCSALSAIIGRCAAWPGEAVDGFIHG